LIHFGKDAGRRNIQNPLAGLFAGSASGDRAAADPAMMKLLPLMALRTEAGASGLAAHRASRGEAANAFLAHAAILREIARRTGEVETLGRAASAVLRARTLAASDRRMQATALLAHAQILSLAATLFGDNAAADVALERLTEAADLPLDPVTHARLDALAASLLARAALATLGVADRGAASGQAAASALVSAARTLDGLAALGKLDDSEAHEVRCDHAELLIGAGQAAKDRHKLELAITLLEDMHDALDAAYRPLTWSRAEILRGQALAALGDLAGEAAAIAEGSVVLTAVWEESLASHSPVDAARAGHALGLVLQSLGEACDEDALFDRAIGAFGPALQALDAAPLLPLRSIVANDGAACLARRAERRGDLPSLIRAEEAFRETLKTQSAAADPLAWAVTQVALARIYEAEADLRGDTGERADAAFALASALDVFAEKGLRSLSEVALTALERVKAHA